MPSKPTHVSTRGRLLRIALRAAIVLPMLAAAAVVLAWLTGHVVSDRYFWSQWLLWIPTLAALLAAAGGLVCAAIWPRTRAVLLAWLVCCAAVLAYFATIENRLLHSSPDNPSGLRIAHWNASRAGGEMNDYIDAVIAADADIVFLTDAGRMPFQPELWEYNDGPPASAHPFAIVTKLPIIRRRQLVYEDDMVALLVEIDTTEQLGRPLVAYAVDMPSELNLSRMELATRFRAMLDEIDAPPPDLVVGDFNMTRNSASIRTMFPEHTHAYDQAGSGYAATFQRGERGWLLYHIDHMLLSDTLHATSYRIIDPGVGRHCMQVATIAAE